MSKTANRDNLGLKRPIDNFIDVGSKDSDDIRVVSYNITADFFDSKDKTEDQHHKWSNRSSYVKQLLTNLDADVMCFQELSPDQALELAQAFGNKYNSVFLSQSPSEIETGKIVTGEEVGDWVGKFAGTPPVGTFVSKDWEIKNSGRFWLNENPDEIPTNRDRSEIDKGFGNMNTYRAVLWTELQHKDAERPIFIFNSHYPLSGGNDTRAKCAEVEMQKIKEIVGDHHWISMGDRNAINDTESPERVYEALTTIGHDVRDVGDHRGPSHTFLGFNYDHFQTKLEHRPESPRHSIPDLMVSDMDAKKSFHEPGGFDPATKTLVGMNPKLLEQCLEQGKRFIASDHALVGADFAKATVLSAPQKATSTPKDPASTRKRSASL